MNGGLNMIRLWRWVAVVVIMSALVNAQETADTLRDAATKGDKVALRRLTDLAEEGDAVAQYHLGMVYTKGEGVSKNDVLAVAWFRQAAEQGNFRAQYNLGVAYLNGEGASKSAALALTWFRKAAEQGYAHAQFGLGMMYDQGEGVTKDTTLALAWFRKAAEQGFAQAQNSLGWAYLSGIGVHKDLFQAVIWFRRAAEQGLATAQVNLGLMYKKGSGVHIDAVQAVAWYRKAAQQGLAAAQFNLGLMYEIGEGVNQDDVQALAWYRKAAAQGLSQAQLKLGLQPTNDMSGSNEVPRPSPQEFTLNTPKGDLVVRIANSTFHSGSPLVLNGTITNSTAWDFKNLRMRVAFYDMSGREMVELCRPNYDVYCSHVEPDLPADKTQRWNGVILFNETRTGVDSTPTKIKRVELFLSNAEYRVKWKFSLVKPTPSDNLSYEDDFVGIFFSLVPSGISCNLRNKTTEPVTVNWNSVSWVDLSGEAHKLVHSGVRLIDKEAPQPPTVIPPLALIKDTMFPVDRIESTSSGWIKAPMWPEFVGLSEDHSSLKIHEGASFSLFMPLEIRGKTKNYNFIFTTKSVEY
jgi:TPR repeat protein